MDILIPRQGVCVKKKVEDGGVAEARGLVKEIMYQSKL